MKRILLLTLLLAGGLHCRAGRIDVKEAKSCCFFSSAPSSFCLYDVVRNDTVTALHLIFRGVPGEVFDIPDMLYLEDKQGKIYPLRSVQGVLLGKKNKCPLMGEVRFSLCFDPVDRKEKYLDLHAASVNLQWFSFWGIHEANRKSEKIPHVAHTNKAQVQNRTQEGDVTIMGTLSIKGETPQKITLHYLPDIGKQASSEVGEDGQFELKQRLDGEIISYLMFGTRTIPVYLHPTDTLFVEVTSGYGKEMKVEYHSAKGNDTHINLMTAMRPRWSYRDKLARQRISPMQLAEEVQAAKAEDESILRYFSWKYDLTAQEAHLFDIDLKVKRVANALACMSFNVRQAYDLDSLLYLPQEARSAFIFSEEAKMCYQYAAEIEFTDKAYTILNPLGLYYEFANIPHVTLCRSIGGRKTMFEALEYYLGYPLDNYWRSKLQIYM